MENNMITNSWDNITPCCCHRHKEPIPMVIQSGPSSPFYACPKYHQENRDPGEPKCNNRISIEDFMKMIEHLQSEMIEADAADKKIFLLNHTWKFRKGIEFKVIKHEGDHIEVSVLNNRAIKS